MITAFSRSLLLASILALIHAAQAAFASAIPSRLQPFIDDGTIAGSVTLVASADRIISVEAMGKADIASGRAMTPDTLFWIASMTKPIVGAAILMLEDDGLLSVEDPVEKHLP
jgi:CubicO group peptidase (beta-lactamase class C family)